MINKLLIAFLFFIVSCNTKTKPYLKHKLELKKMSDNCAGADEKIRSEGNINGERYEFNKCVNANFKEDDLIVERKGDTVSVQFKERGNQKAEYHFIVDINTYPRYNT